MKKLLISYIILAFNLMISNTYSQTIDTLVSVGDHHLHFTITPGTGMPILLEHGYGNDGSVWKNITKAISDSTNAPVIAYDRAGWGKSSMNKNREGIENEIADLEMALIKLGYKKGIMLVSHSLGGLYNAVFASRNPKKVKGIIFIDASIPCFYTQDVLSKLNAPFLSTTIETAKKYPIPCQIPLVDIIAEKTITNKALFGEKWKACHDEFVSASPKRKSIIAYNSGHYVFLDNRKLVIEIIMKLYNDIN